MVGARLRYLLILAALAAFCVANGRWLSWILLLAILALPLLSLLVSIPAMFGARMHISAPRQTQIGAPARVTASVTYPWLELPSKMRLRVTNLLSGETKIIRSQGDLPSDHCGGFSITAKRAICYDLMGLFSHKLRKPEPVRVCVMPTPAQDAQIQGLEQHVSLSLRPKPGGGYSEQHELREYRPGDNLNQIHWKLSAKTGDLIIREPMEPMNTRMLLTLDLAGTPDQLDRKLGRLLGLGQYLLEQNLHFSVMALTGTGPSQHEIASMHELQACLEELLCSPKASDGSILTHHVQANWHYHIGDEANEV